MVWSINCRGYCRPECGEETTTGEMRPPAGAMMRIGCDTLATITAGQVPDGAADVMADVVMINGLWQKRDYA